MRIPFVHVATVEMGADDDDRAPGAAVTLALRGSKPGVLSPSERAQTLPMAGP